MKNKTYVIYIRLMEKLERLYIEAEDFIHPGDGTIVFTKGEDEELVAVFNLSEIAGFELMPDSTPKN